MIPQLSFFNLLSSLIIDNRNNNRDSFWYKCWYMISDKYFITKKNVITLNDDNNIKWGKSSSCCCCCCCRNFKRTYHIIIADENIFLKYLINDHIFTKSLITMNFRIFVINFIFFSLISLLKYFEKKNFTLPMNSALFFFGSSNDYIS